MIFLTERYSQSIDNILLSLYLLVYYLLIKVIYVNQDQSVESVFKAISIAAVIEAVFGIIQHFNPYFLGASVNLGYETQVIASFGGANSLGCFLALSVPCILYLIKRTSVRYQKGLWLFGLVIICTALILTLSRGAWIALFAGLSFYFSPYLIQFCKSLRTNNKKLLWALYSIVVLIIGFGFFIIYNQNLESSIGRIFLWKVSLLMFLDKPVLGIGYGNYSYLFPDYQAKFFDNPDNVIYIDKACNIKMAHSEFFHILAETGIIGILLFIILIVSIGIVLFRLLRTVKNENRNTIIRLMGTILVIILTHSIVDTVLHVLPISLVFYTCVAYLSSHNDHQNHSLITIRLRPKLLFIFLFLILLGISGYNGYRKINGHYYWRQGLTRVSQHKWREGIDSYQKAMKFLPDNDELQFHLGSAYSYTNELEKAFAYLNQSLSSFKDKNQYMVLGITCMNLDKFELAEHYLRQTTYMFPQMLYPHFLLAQMYDRSGFLIKSMSELQYIIEAEPRIMSEEVRTIKRDAARVIKIIESKLAK
ncbi:MAG: O-antigen ligase family protein [Fidelibacterota bacterium]